MRSGIHVEVANALQLWRCPVSAVVAILNSDRLGHHSGLLSINKKLLFTSQEAEASWNCALSSSYGIYLTQKEDKIDERWSRHAMSLTKKP
jgi:hypothetical protein